MKKLVNFALVTSLMLLVNLNTFAIILCSPGGVPGGGGDTGAPLDGGILALLAAAGISYFAVRKKKKNKE